ncbi:sulfite exporter TauE/SafE family protein [Luteibaculum oceani]|uniref:Probable membrane transporter protein n=1 Tax=Luteibaculum oceani TaxID=1294296 RepID=A0A5C6USE6_9FLAO|nr:sulfite exporter TauE/SafE family protein [Luteibaculum oceani]TXC76253.1 sulfite exporter TauE/SafE family protein [Luteibaculum oceani]
MEILGYFSAIIIGVSLGLIGGGGSILTVPVLVYFMGEDPVLATAYSLFIVGLSALVGAVKNYRLGNVDVKTALIFAPPSFIAVYLTRLWIIPAIPATMDWGFGSFTKSTLLMVFFALVMLIAAVAMLKPKKESQLDLNQSKKMLPYHLIVLEGILVGVVTGLVGAGGGFLIIPALVLLAKIPMKKAVGTSLLIIAAKSLIGFIGDVQSGANINWMLLASFTLLAIIGIFLGTYISKFVSGKKLKHGFAYFVLAMAVVIVSVELF